MVYVNVQAWKHMLLELGDNLITYKLITFI